MAAKDSAAEHDCRTTLSRWWAFAGLILFGATWKLWIPQSEFPQVPLFGWAGSLPLFVNWLAFGGLLGVLATIAWRPSSSRSWLAFACALSVLIAVDQHRLQPWAWQLLLMAFVFATSQVSGKVLAGGRSPENVDPESPVASAIPLNVRAGELTPNGTCDTNEVAGTFHVPSAVLRPSAVLKLTAHGMCLLLMLRVLTISIYFWSAISKFDASFFASHGQTLVEALFQSVGLTAVVWPASVKWWLAFALPIGELLVAVGLCWPRTRRAALIAATALHVGLLLALGPTGLGHRPGVLLWNVAFIGHGWLLFLAPKGAELESPGRSPGKRTDFKPISPEGAQHNESRPFGAENSAASRSVSEGGRRDSDAAPSLMLRVSMLVVLFACVWPITERWGLCDRWLAWSVYSARIERVSVTLTDEGVRRLPESARRLVVDGELWLDRWSLAVLNVPVYPQLRFQFGIVEWLRQRCGEENLVEVSVQHSQRDGGFIERLTVSECDERRRSFWINTSSSGTAPKNLIHHPHEADGV